MGWVVAPSKHAPMWGRRCESRPQPRVGRETQIGLAPGPPTERHAQRLAAFVCAWRSMNRGGQMELERVRRTPYRGSHVEDGNISLCCASKLVCQGMLASLHGPPRAMDTPGSTSKAAIIMSVMTLPIFGLNSDQTKEEFSGSFMPAAVFT